MDKHDVCMPRVIINSMLLSGKDTLRPCNGLEDLVTGATVMPFLDSL